MKRKDLVKILKNIPRNSEVFVNGKEIEATITWDSATHQYSITLTEREDAAADPSDK